MCTAPCSPSSVPDSEPRRQQIPAQPGPTLTAYRDCPPSMGHVPGDVKGHPKSVA